MLEENQRSCGEVIDPRLCDLSTQSGPRLINQSGLAEGDLQLGRSVALLGGKRRARCVICD
jgi:hypothetical protein